jgi:hypothetical protein
VLFFFSEHVRPDVLLQGAAAIGEYLVKTYGKDSISMIVDEGGRLTPID